MNMRVLESIKLFQKLSASEKGKIVAHFQLEIFKKDSSIVKEGDRGTKFYIVEEGTAKVISNGQTVTELQAGTYFGEMALLDDDVRKASVIASSNCECFVLDRSAFNKILGSLQNILNRDVEERKKGIDGAASGEGCNIKFN